MSMCVVCVCVYRLIPYCSSDVWSGTGPTPVKAGKGKEKEKEKEKDTDASKTFFESKFTFQFVEEN